MLDWVETPGFLRDLQALVAPVPCRIPADAIYLPHGHAAPTEARLDTFGRKAFPDSAAWDELRRWWLRHPKGANTPNWDLAVSCEIDGAPGLILAEAKANVPELSEAGKAPDRQATDRSIESRQRSGDNSDHIAAAIESARLGLCMNLPTIAISRDTHYQLSNRLAFAWKLASSGIPTVLLYLGFIGDSGMKVPLQTEAQWHDLFRSHLKAVCPSDIPETPLQTESARFWVLCRARQVLEPSSPGKT